MVHVNAEKDDWPNEPSHFSSNIRTAIAIATTTAPTTATATRECT